MQQVSAKATGMALSLWFTEKDKADNMPKTIIAAGQFTTCFNLLDYLDKLKASSWNASERIEELKACETQLREMWEKFRENPYWLVDSIIE